MSRVREDRCLVGYVERRRRRMRRVKGRGRKNIARIYIVIVDGIELNYIPHTARWIHSLVTL